MAALTEEQSIIRDQAKAWAADDPYAKAGLFASVELTAWKKVIG